MRQVVPNTLDNIKKFTVIIYGFIFLLSIFVVIQFLARIDLPIKQISVIGEYQHIDKEQVEFLEAFLLFCLLEDSPIISTAELVEIDSNALLVAHQGRRPGLKMGSFGQKIDLAEWGENIFKRIKQCVKLLSGAHQNSVENISARIQNPDLTPSAIILNQMQSQEKGFFEFTNQYSLDYKAKSLKKIFDKDHFNELNNLAIKSKKEQLEIESSQTLNFDEYLKNYFLDDV